jgi:5-methyltetrahydrofolate--homocysteine methyltransferase
MGVVLDALAERKILVSDGAWGTLLQAAGLKVGECGESWNLVRPEAVRAVAAAYVEAGADMVLTNSFGGSLPVLKKYGLAERAAEINRAAAELSLAAAGTAGGAALVAASVGPTGEMLEPLGAISSAGLEEVFRVQIAALLEGGVRALCVETMTAVEEAACAVRAAKALDEGVDVIATMSFDRTASGYRTMMGVDPARAVSVLTDAGADILGSNCGQGIEQMVALAAEFSSLTDKPILIHANAGLPELVDGEAVYRQTPEMMARFVPELVRSGAVIVGGCCGTGPEHIRAMREQVDALL